ncbi:MAG: hypothetical protein AB1756_07775 [Acidobacteriota bacterium]
MKRVNSRIDGSFSFERHFVRGKAKMTLKAGLALVVMLSMALARIRRNQGRPEVSHQASRITRIMVSVLCMLGGTSLLLNRILGEKESVI